MHPSYYRERNHQHSRVYTILSNDIAMTSAIAGKDTRPASFLIQNFGPYSLFPRNILSISLRWRSSCIPIVKRIIAIKVQVHPTYDLGRRLPYHFRYDIFRFQYHVAMILPSVSRMDVHASLYSPWVESSFLGFYAKKMRSLLKVIRLSPALAGYKREEITGMIFPKNIIFDLCIAYTRKCLTHFPVFANASTDIE